MFSQQVVILWTVVFNSTLTLQLAQELLQEHWKTNNPELRKVSDDGLCSTETQNVNLKDCVDLSRYIIKF